MAWFASLKRWFSRIPVQRPDLHVVMYTRKACPLCDEAWQVLQSYQQQYGFALDSRDVDDAGEEALCSYGKCVPVVIINGRVRFRGHINPVLLERILASP